MDGAKIYRILLEIWAAENNVTIEITEKKEEKK